MVDNAVKSWLDIAPAYMNFTLKFVRDPRQAFSKVAGSADVSSDLTSILLGGVALSYLIVMLGGSPGLKQVLGVSQACCVESTIKRSRSWQCW